MIDAELFGKSNPSYARLFTKKYDGAVLDLWGSSTGRSDSEQAKSNGIGPDMKDEDLLVYPATPLGFSLNDKFWG